MPQETAKGTRVRVPMMTDKILERADQIHVIVTDWLNRVSNLEAGYRTLTAQNKELTAALADRNETIKLLFMERAAFDGAIWAKDQEIKRLASMVRLALGGKDEDVIVSGPVPVNPDRFPHQKENDRFNYNNQF